MMLRKFTLLFLLSLISCTYNNTSKNEIHIFQGRHFDSDQSYQLIIDDGKYIRDISFKNDYRASKFKRLKSYKTDQDSVEVYFKLDNKDTTFVISPSHIDSLLVGSTAYGEIYIGTDQQKSIWQRR